MTPQNHVSLDEFHFIAKQLRPMVNEDFLLQLEVSIVSANHKSDAILPLVDPDFKPGLSIAPRSNFSHKKSPPQHGDGDFVFRGGEGAFNRLYSSASSSSFSSSSTSHTSGSHSSSFSGISNSSSVPSGCTTNHSSSSRPTRT